MSTPTILGRIEVVAARDVWKNEAHDFTPWLMQNADVLSELLGMDLVLETAEHPVGGFSLDLIGRDEIGGQVVIIENQLEVSDHTHLGQILTYAAGTDPTTVVWVAAGFRPEHRAALDWLNERTNEDTRFFGVQIEVVRIGDSEPAPAFKLIAQPNDWNKHVKAATQSAGLSERSQLYWDFWARFTERVRAKHPTWTRATTTKNSFLAMSAGSGLSSNYTSSFGGAGLGLVLEFIDSDADVNTNRYDALIANKAEMEAAFGGPLAWEELDGRKSARVGVYSAGANIAETDRWNEYIEWLIDAGERLRAAVNAAGGVPVV